jgi:ATP-dependent DNA helicase RecQ
VSYIPAKKTPFVVYTCNRLDATKIHLSKTIYDDRRERYQTRTDAMLQYATAETGCRSQMLLRYFGQTDNKPCGQCDLCLKNKTQNVQQTEFETIAQEIENLLKEKPHTATEIVTAVKKHTDEKTFKVIRFLMDEGKIEQEGNGKLRWM